MRGPWFETRRYAALLTMRWSVLRRGYTSTSTQATTAEKSPDLILRSTREASVSRRMGQGRKRCRSHAWSMVRDAPLRGAPHHEVERVEARLHIHLNPGYDR